MFSDRLIVSAGARSLSSIRHGACSYHVRRRWHRALTVARCHLGPDHGDTDNPLAQDPDPIYQDRLLPNETLKQAFDRVWREVRLKDEEERQESDRRHLDDVKKLQASARCYEDQVVSFHC